MEKDRKDKKKKTLHYKSSNTVLRRTSSQFHAVQTTRLQPKRVFITVPRGQKPFMIQTTVKT